MYLVFQVCPPNIPLALWSQFWTNWGPVSQTWSGVFMQAHHCTSIQFRVILPAILCYLNLPGPPRYIISIALPHEVFPKPFLQENFPLSVPRNHKTNLTAPFGQFINTGHLVCAEQCIMKWGHKCKKILCSSYITDNNKTMYLFHSKYIINLKVAQHQHYDYKLFDVRVCVLLIFVFSTALIMIPLII